MKNPTLEAAIIMGGTMKCEGCKRAERNWRGFLICEKGFSPKRCGKHYLPKQSLILKKAESLFK